MDFYNAVLRPPADFSDALIDFARRNFASLADGYCLGPGQGLPHLTLCQTPLLSAEKAAALQRRVETIDVPQNLALSCHQYIAHHVARADGGAPVIYCGLGVSMPNPGLSALQAEIADIYAVENVEPRNKSRAAYWPHLTFARVSPDATMPALIFPDNLWRAHENWTLAFGRGDIAGQLLEVFPTKAPSTQSSFFRNGPDIA